MPKSLTVLVHMRKTVSVGDRFGRLTVSGMPFRVRRNFIETNVVCRCDCGNADIFNLANLRNGHAKCCGCLRVDAPKTANRTHGGRHRPEYRIWSHMKYRCENPKCERFPHYGGRGITVCDRWRNDFSAFFEDMGPRPSNKHSIDRIDNDGNYEPGNCRWLLTKAQGRNQRTNRHITVRGKTRTLAEWSQRSGIGAATIHRRLKAGWTAEKAVRTPVKRLPS